MSDEDNKSKGDKLLYCSFCGKSQHEVRKLIAGPSVFVCDECVELCNEIIREESEDSGGQGSRGSRYPTPQEICERLDDYVISQEEAKKVLFFTTQAQTKPQEKTPGKFKTRSSRIISPGP